MSLKRSVINQSIESALAEFARHRIRVPTFAAWTVDDWTGKGHEVDEIRVCRLGWEVTDFGMGDFSHFGRTLLTLRNGTRRTVGYPKPYAEKLILLPGGQRSVPHFHRAKREDIIARAGGDIILKFSGLASVQPAGEAGLHVQVDGQTVALGADGLVRLQPGQSVCIEPGMIHQFWGAEGGEAVIAGEVSTVNDDASDNFFVEPLSQFAATIEEDEKLRYYLSSEYPPVE